MKRNFIFKTSIIIASFALTGCLSSGSANNNNNNNNFTPFPSTNGEISESLYSSLVYHGGVFGKGKSFIATVTSASNSSMIGTGKYVNRVQDGKIEINSDKDDTEYFEVLYSTYSKYTRKVDTDIYSYDNGMYKKQTSSISIDTLLINMGIIPVEFSDLTYDPRTSSYSLSKEGMTIFGDNITIDSYTISFNNNFPSSISMSLSNGDSNATVEAKYSNVGSTKVTLPDTETPDPSHEHTFSDSWDYDEHEHWHPATCGHNVRDGVEPHNMVQVDKTQPDYDNPGYLIYECDVCGYRAFNEYTPALEHHFSDEWSFDNKCHWHACIDEGYEDVKSDYETHNLEKVYGTFDGVTGYFNVCHTCDYYSLVSEETIKTVEIYASNDFHGMVEESSSSGYLGLRKFGSYFKDKAKNDNTLLLDQGDSWQGSIYSNINYGAVVDDVMSSARFSARTIGNHDFDWGLEHLKANTARKYNGYQIPVLAANVFDYEFDSKTVGIIQQSDIGTSSVTYTLENGLKVGVVGVIGKDQITSITSSYIKDITFVDHINTIKNVSQSLRNSGCDIVIASCHTGQDSVMGYGLENYVDLVLCGHTHMYEVSQEGNLCYAQFGQYGQHFGHVTLTYDSSSSSVTNTEVTTLDYYDLRNTSVDSEINNIVTSYENDCETAANEVVASNVNGFFSKGEAAPNMMCKAIMDTAIANGHNDICLSYVNVARQNLYSGSWTYADIYSAFPFDNVIYIIEVTANEFRREISQYNYICKAPWFDGVVDSSQKYKIAVIDYVAFHTNSYRDYDYFPDNAGNYVDILHSNYRLLLKKWLADNGYKTGKALNANDFVGDQFNKDFTYR